MEDWLSTEVALGGLLFAAAAPGVLDLDTVFPALDPLRSGLDGADGGAAPAEGVTDAGGGVGVISAVAAAYRD